MPKDFSSKDARELFLGLQAMGQEFNCPVVGGDVGVWSGPLAISVTVFARPSGMRLILRSGAKVGDAICVTGALGGAWKSQRHLNFMPRIREARLLASRHEVHAMIDLSDGLSRDLRNLCNASGVGAEIAAEAVPISPDAKAAMEPAAALASALGDGEDYELLFTLPVEQADQLLQSNPLSMPVSRIGTIIAGDAVTLVYADGRHQKLPQTGWEYVTSG